MKHVTEWDLFDSTIQIQLVVALQIYKVESPYPISNRIHNYTKYAPEDNIELHFGLL